MILSTYTVTGNANFSDFYVANNDAANRGVPAEDFFNCKPPVDGEAAYRMGRDGITVTPDNSTSCTQANLSGCQQYCKLPNNNIVFRMSFEDLLQLSVGIAGDQNSLFLQESIDNPNKPVIFIDTEWYSTEGSSDERDTL